MAIVTLTGKMACESELLRRGYSRRTTAAEPRLSELVAEYERIGYDVKVIEHRPPAEACSVCYERCAEICADVYVRFNPATKPSTSDRT